MVASGLLGVVCHDTEVNLTSAIGWCVVGVIYEKLLALEESKWSFQLRRVGPEDRGTTLNLLIPDP